MLGLTPLLLAAGAASTALDEVRIRPTGFIDIGWFDAAGDGVAYDRDFGNLELPGRAGEAAWVYWGDPWANTVNSQGDPADLGLSRTNVPRVDPVASGGNPTFIVNTLEQGLDLSAGPSLVVRTALWVEPRSGQLGALGDLVSLDRAYLEWIPLDTVDLHLYAGKVPSAFGIEYRVRRAPQRAGVTPSLVARYTTGLPVGVRAKASFLDRTLWVTASVTNGSTTTERFGHLSDELDANGVPTTTARVGVRHDGAALVELGASGQVGPQDAQPDPGLWMWQVGGDLRVNLEPLRLRVEYLLSDQDQGDPAVVDTLHAQGGYAELQAQLAPWAGPTLRVDRRDAELHAGNNLYVSDVVRVTAGARFDINDHLMAKLEYLILRELKGPELPDNVFTSSAVFWF